MDYNMKFYFTLDKTTNTIFLNREFKAELPLVWDAFTKPEILDQWWAPKPWTCKTKSMNFHINGRRFYAMVSPEGQENWSIQEFTSITPQTNFQFFDAFTDKDENVNREFPVSGWELNFSELDGTTTVKMIIKEKTLADLEKIIEMGFEEGFKMTLNQLENLLTTLSQK